MALELEGANPLVPLVLLPEEFVTINASVELDFRISDTEGLVIDGEIAHDCMPAFELYVDGTAAYTWAPSTATLGSLGRIGVCLAPPKNERGSFQCTKDSQGGFTCRGQ